MTEAPETQEAQHDPALNDHANVGRGYWSDEEADDHELLMPKRGIMSNRATGEHPTLRATSTDNRTVKPIGEGDEQPSHVLCHQEPEDKMPDQLDRNK